MTTEILDRTPDRLRTLRIWSKVSEETASLSGPGSLTEMDRQILLTTWQMEQMWYLSQGLLATSANGQKPKAPARLKRLGIEPKRDGAIGAVGAILAVVAATLLQWLLTGRPPVP